MEKLKNEPYVCLPLVLKWMVSEAEKVEIFKKINSIFL